MGAATAKRHYEAPIREREVVELRQSGGSFRDIAQLVKVTEQAVGKIYRRAVQRIIKQTDQTADESRWQEVDRLDALLNAHWPFAMKGDVKSSNIVLRISERRSALLGLDAPKRVEVEDVTDIDKQIDKLLARAKDRSEVPHNSGEVPPSMEIDCAQRAINSSGDNVVELVDIGGSWLGKDANGS